MEAARAITLVWLGLFALDTAVGALQALGSMAGAWSAFGGAVGVTSLLLWLGTSVFLACWVALPRTPWWALLVFVWLGWEGGGFLPLPAATLDLEGSARIAAFLQVGLAVGIGLLARRRLLAEPGERAVLVAAVRSLLLPLLFLVGIGVQAVLAAWSLSIATGGFARIDATGLETGQRECTKGDRTIHLIGAVHIGEQDGYDALLASIPEDALLLAEGVTDDAGHLGTFSYDGLAEAIGLVPQRSGAAEPGSVEAEGDGRFRTRRADVDVSTFDPRTLELLCAVGESLATDDPFKAWMRSSTEIVIQEGTLEALRQDILDGRNDTLLAAVDEELPRESRLLIPWGALHLRGIQRGVEERGFDCGPASYVRMIRWSTVIEAIRTR